MKNQWEEKWIEDINYLRDNLIEKHKNLFFNITSVEFERKIEDLKSIINKLDFDEMKVELSRVVASIGDAHTSISFPANRYLPIKFYWFEDGVYIIGATEKYKDLLCQKVIAIEGMKIERVIEELSEIISYENQYFFTAQSMKYMQVADVLYGLLIADSKDMLRIETENGEFVVGTIGSDELVYFNNKLPLYARRANENLWYEYLESENEVYIKYNYCREDGHIRLSEKIKNLIEFIEEKSVRRVTLDLRNNLGGDSTLIEPLLNYIKNNNRINTKENLKVIIGRETFSSGLLNAYELKSQTKALILGEPSGGKPNCYGEILRFTLPNSKFVVSYSTKYYKIIEDDNIMALYPDVIIQESINDFK